MANVSKCKCCFSCIQGHSENGCSQCSEFLKSFFPASSLRKKYKKSVYSELSSAINALFSAMNAHEVVIDGSMSVRSESFVKDFINNIADVKTEDDIIRIWQVDWKVAVKLCLVVKDVLSENINTSDTSQDSSDNNSETNSSESEVFDDSDEVTDETSDEDL